ncbi:hypothetical protein DPMN_111762 [Dreissena polymorpha]|uniref:Uncharacterized protein n=1 Tax=Dreissena polymorpha TaxID=45954 RepID=A0A9D4KF97_DREPO|nr:hypothetical protein DPMN_111762 [Dreissena polymorpha]
MFGPTIHGGNLTEVFGEKALNAHTHITITQSDTSSFILDTSRQPKRTDLIKH